MGDSCPHPPFCVYSVSHWSQLVRYILSAGGRINTYWVSFCWTTDSWQMKVVLNTSRLHTRFSCPMFSHWQRWIKRTELDYDSNTNGLSLFGINEKNKLRPFALVVICQKTEERSTNLASFLMFWYFCVNRSPKTVSLVRNPIQQQQKKQNET